MLLQLLLAIPSVVAATQQPPAAPLLPELRLVEAPSDLRLYPRDAENRAWVVLEGEVPGGTWESVEFEAWRDGTPWRRVQQPLTTGRGRTAAFELTIEIEAGLFVYDFEARLHTTTHSRAVVTAAGVVSGDAFLIQGQSNAVATDYHGEQLANQSQRPWIRSFGTASLAPGQVRRDLQWHLADGLGANGPGTVGAWGLRMAQLLVDTYGVPVGLLNGAVGGTPISFHQRNDLDRGDLSTNYGRLLYRAHKAGVRELAKALLWYQGESDGSNAAAYGPAFERLYDAWNEDFPGLERVYVFQVREGCGQPSLELRDVQRRFADVLPTVEVMATTAAPRHDGCHFFYAGYEELGDRMARILAREFHSSPLVRDIEPPNPKFAQFLSPARDEVLIVFRNADDTLVWEGGSEAYFDLAGAPETVVSGKVVGGRALLLTLSGPTQAAAVSYRGHSGDGPWVTNARGVGALAFFQLPIRP